ncbi:hypothetical protein SAMN05216421_1112 [Halopseudomonas xinjiangensis]|uniref:Tape measure domain-containing protein n=1 Tax=Halopseudomonas xinjiangensis TaxID=487184 RepID=A0A1H1QDT2_9GAMM|nr:hypothetical protein [Halopseudomonas xinjiangensis]SDS21463.1 hypothetical protein SAMN05216421_1112 [Halopseudomonas xinjiangensis]
MTTKTQIIIEGINKAGRAFTDANKQLLNLDSAAKKAGAAIAGALSVGVVSAWVKESINAADESRKLAQAAGLTTEAFTGLSFAAGQSGLNAQQLTNSMSRLSQVVQQAAEGSDRQATLFRSMGISIKDAEGNLRSSEAILGVIADRFQSMPDGIEKSALAAELFGRNLGGKMIPLLNGGAEGIKALTDQAERLGLVISDEQAKASEEFNDNLSVLGGVSRGAANTIAGEVLPTLNELSGLMIDLSEDGDNARSVADALGAGLKLLASIAIGVATAFGMVGRAIGGAAAAAALAAQGEFSAAADVLRNVVADNEEALASSSERIRKLWDGTYAEVGAGAAQASGDLRELNESMVENAERAHQAMSDSYKNLVRDAKAALRELVSDEKSAQRDIAKLREERLAIESRYAEAIAKFNGAGAGGPSYSQAQDLKLSARQALQRGDIETAQKQAQAALKILEQLSDAGENTYGFEGFAKELQRIELGANAIEQSNADKKIEGIKSQMESLQAKITELEKIDIKIELPESEKQNLINQMEELRKKLGKPISIRAEIAGASGSTGSDIPGFATGGSIRGPGTGTSDSMLIRASNGEYMIKAAAVRKYGVNLLDQINGMRLPKFADGGLVGNIQPASSGTPLNLSLEGQTFSLNGDSGTIEDLARVVRSAKLKRR